MSKNIRRITYTALAAAIVFTVTRLFVFTVSASGSYVNFGDIAIYIISYLFGGPLAALASGIGSGLADLTAGAAVYAPATLIIKGLMGLIAGCLMLKRKFWIYALACVLCGAVMVVGYGLYDICIGGFGAAVSNAIPGNMIQWGASVVIALLLYPVAVRIQKVTHFDELK
ncbi:energy-coupling factor transport system substrate-specific component [Sporobacter termitidis DSM 10068]|uniref:Energy-coupling factor transport system substrate-specific component n=1 Tax=Sporobacter termitidis DSM 10068 TaxID=1123282 RepID=A0A1M5YUP3_9FIRM|nr:ECF transporter S component [Sporobacter termitidis]SHI15293.1 energy-coupling factor transport system substrate-specific component [Sporobacter termitidis DSM 10068]